MKSHVILSVLSLFLSACSGDDSAPPNSEGQGGTPSSGGAGGASAAGGTSGESGAGGGSTGGVAGGVSSVTKGAVSLHIQSGPGCSLSDQFRDVPTLSSGHPVTDAAKVQAVENGGTTPDGQPVSLTCRWLGFQAPYTFQAAIQIGPTGIPRSIGVGASIEPGKDVLGGVTLASPDLPQQYGSEAADPCIYTVISTDVATRSVWGRVNGCALVSTDGTDSCSIGDSYFFFENCTVPAP